MTGLRKAGRCRPSVQARAVRMAERKPRRTHEWDQITNLDLKIAFGSRYNYVCYRSQGYILYAVSIIMAVLKSCLIKNYRSKIREQNVHMYDDKNMHSV